MGAVYEIGAGVVDEMDMGIGDKMGIGVVDEMDMGIGEECVGAGSPRPLQSPPQYHMIFGDGRGMNLGTDETGMGAVMKWGWCRDEMGCASWMKWARVSWIKLGWASGMKWIWASCMNA